MTAIKSSRIVIYALAIAAAFCAVAFHQYRDFFHDDAFIALRYCYNLLHGHGLVWNPGERVEGYTSFLHVLLISTIGALGVDLVIVARAIGIAAFLGLGGYLLHVAYRLRVLERQNATILAATLLLGVCSVPIVIWSLGGLETVLYTLLVTAAGWTFVCQLRRPPRDGWPLGLLFALLAMTRPDGALLCFVAGGFAIYGWARGRFSRRYVVGFAVAGTLACGAFLLWRYAYYGALLPNTYYAKTGISTTTLLFGAEYLLRFLLAPPLLGPVLLLCLVGILLRRCVSIQMMYLLTTVATYFTYVVSVGGDHMAGYRFLVPMIPLSALLANLCLQKLYRRGLRHIPAWSAILCPLLIALQLYCPSSGMTRAWRVDPAAYFGKVVGDHVRTHWPADALIASNSAGALPYYCPNHRFIDMLGLNDAVIARRKVAKPQLLWQFVPGHLKGDGAYVLSRAPDYIILGSARGAHRTGPWFLSDLELLELPQFHARYRYREVRIPLADYPHYRRYEALEDGFCEMRYWERVEPGLDVVAACADEGYGRD